MTENRKPGRPKAEDPKIAVTLRVKRSVLASYQAGGDDWRARMEAAIEADDPLFKPFKGGPIPSVSTAKTPAATKVQVPLAGTFERKPMQKTGKR